MKSFNLRLAPTMHAAIRDRAWMAHMSMTAWIQNAIQAALEHRGWPNDQIDVSVPQLLARHLEDALTVEQVQELMKELVKGQHLRIPRAR